MTYRGKVMNGVVVLEGEASIPDGTEVSVEPIPVGQARQDGAGLSAFFDIWRRAKATGIPDLAVNHDHYLYGHPKAKP
jgi:hypothetical protein